MSLNKSYSYKILKSPKNRYIDLNVNFYINIKVLYKL